MTPADILNKLENLKLPSIYLTAISGSLVVVFLAHYYWTSVRKLKTQRVHLFYISLVGVATVCVIAVESLFVSAFKFDTQLSKIRQLYDWALILSLGFWLSFLTMDSFIVIKVWSLATQLEQIQT